MNLNEVKEYLLEGSKIRDKMSADMVFQAGKIVADAVNEGGKLVLFGNGGSAADAQHIAAELVGRFEKERRPLPALALHTNTSSLTAISNDYSYDEVYSRQVLAFCTAKDVVIGISTSGNSPNVLKALEVAKSMGCRTLAMTGETGGKMLGIADLTLQVPSKRTSYIQEVHIAIGHIISKIVEDSIK